MTTFQFNHHNEKRIRRAKIAILDDLFGENLLTEQNCELMIRHEKNST